MPRRIQSLIIVTLSVVTIVLTVPNSTPATAFDDTVIAKISYPAWFKQSFYNLGDDLADAEQSGKRGVLVFFSTQGCSYCHLMLEKTFADPALAERVKAGFDVIGLEIFDDAEITDTHGETLPIKAFAVREGAQFAPTLLFYDTGGELALRLVGYYAPARLALALDYLDERRAGGDGFKAWLERRQAARAVRSNRPGAAETTGLIDDPLFSAPPYQLDRSRIPAERPLLVLFESDPCPRCLRFHREVLADPEVRAKLADFELVRLDAEDQDTPVLAPDGSATTPAQWRKALDFTHLPAMAWFDPRGRQVLETDALVLKGRFLNSLGFVRDRAYAKGWTYQRYARSSNLEKQRNAQQ